MNGRPKATGILDTINACIAHGIEVPSELMDVTMRRDVEAAAVAEWFEGYLGIPLNLLLKLSFPLPCIFLLSFCSDVSFVCLSAAVFFMFPSFSVY